MPSCRESNWAPVYLTAAGVFPGRWDVHWRWWPVPQTAATWQLRRRLLRTQVPSGSGVTLCPVEKRATHYSQMFPICRFQACPTAHRWRCVRDKHPPVQCADAFFSASCEFRMKGNTAKAPPDSHLSRKSDRLKSHCCAPSLQISFIASCPCLSDRRKFSNFFRTIPSDVYQARAMARLAARFRWSWIGAVAVNSDDGRLAMQVVVLRGWKTDQVSFDNWNDECRNARQPPLLKAFQRETRGTGVCLEFIEMFSRETIVIDAKRAALTIESSTARGDSHLLLVYWRQGYIYAERNTTLSTGSGAPRELSELLWLAAWTASTFGSMSRQCGGAPGPVRLFRSKAHKKKKNNTNTQTKRL